MPQSQRAVKLDLNHLEKQPQKSLETVHTILTNSINDLEEKLCRLQWSFYGKDRDAVDELTKWSPLLRRVVNGTKVKGLFSVDQMEEISRKEAEGRGAFANDLFTIHQMMECCRKTEEAVPGGEMNAILVDVKKILGLLRKYCSSFYDANSDPVIETAAAYEKQRQRYINAINETMEKVFQLADRFKSNGEAITMLDFSTVCVELARKTETTNEPFLLLFPEACENIRLALTAMRSWIEDDGNFAVFLENDAKEMERRKAEVQKQVRTLNQACHQLGFRLKQNQVEAEHLEEELEKTQSREDALIVEEEMLTARVNEMESELDSTEFRKSEWARNSGSRTGDTYNVKYNELSERVRELKAKVPAGQQQLTAVKTKLRWVEGKRAELKAEEKRRKQLEAEIDDVSSRLFESEVELSGITRALDAARKIILCKRSSDVVEKIFYDQQIVRPHKNKKKGDHDVFDRVCAIVAKHIDKDWPALYRVLPFHPPRGLSTIDKDIFDLLNRESRGGKRHLARMAIDRWRRNHTRAKVEDLEVALEVIHRSDIVRHMNVEVHPPQPEVVVQSEIPDWVDAELIPYWREIERYDQIMAAHSGSNSVSQVKQRPMASLMNE